MALIKKVAAVKKVAPEELAKADIQERPVDLSYEIMVPSIDVCM